MAIAGLPATGDRLRSEKDQWCSSPAVHRRFAHRCAACLALAGGRWPV